MSHPPDMISNNETQYAWRLLRHYTSPMLLATVQKQFISVRCVHRSSGSYIVFKLQPIDGIHLQSRG